MAELAPLSPLFSTDGDEEGLAPLSPLFSADGDEEGLAPLSPLSPAGGTVVRMGVVTAVSTVDEDVEELLPLSPHADAEMTSWPMDLATEESAPLSPLSDEGNRSPVHGVSPAFLNSLGLHHDMLRSVGQSIL